MFLEFGNQGIWPDILAYYKRLQNAHSLRLRIPNAIIKTIMKVSCSTEKSGIYKLAVDVEIPVAVAVPADVAFRAENCHL